MKNGNDSNEEKKNMPLIERIKKMIFKGEADYLEMFVRSASIALEAAKMLKDAFRDFIINDDELANIKKVEHMGDKHMRESLLVIEEAFITPIDQSDIISILMGIEEATDSIDDVASHVHMMMITERDRHMLEFLDTMVLSYEKLYELMVALKKFKKVTNKDVNSLVIEINTLEEKGDRIYRESMRNLFESEKDPVNIIKKKEIYQLFEETLDCSEEVADMVENLLIVRK